MSCFMGCDVNSRTAPRWVTGDLMLTVIRTLSGKCYTIIFPLVVLSLSLAAMSLWLHSLEAENQTDGDVFVFKRCQSVFCVFTARPCRWKVKAVGVKDASALMCRLPGGPAKERRGGLWPYWVAQNRLFSHHGARACASGVRNPTAVRSLHTHQEFLRI